MKKLFVLSVLALMAAGLTSCGETSVDKAAANQRVAAAMNEVTAEQFGSFVLKVRASATVDMTMSDGSNSETGHIEGSASLDVRASALFEETAEASLAASVSYTETYGQSSVSMSQSIAAYLKDGYFYADGSGATDLLDISSGDVTKIKTYVGNLGDLLDQVSEVSEVESQYLDPEVIAPYLNDIENVKATEKDGDLTVTYTITLDDVARLYVDAMVTAVGDTTSITDSQIAEAEAQILAQLEQIISVEEFTIVVGVSKDGYFNKFYIDGDVTITVPDSEVSEVVHVVASLHIDLTDVNGTVAVTFPDDLEDYQLVSNS